MTTLGGPVGLSVTVTVPAFAPAPTGLFTGEQWVASAALAVAPKAATTSAKTNTRRLIEIPLSAVPQPTTRDFLKYAADAQSVREGRITARGVDERRDARRAFRVQ